MAAAFRSFYLFRKKPLPCGKVVYDSKQGEGLGFIFNCALRSLSPEWVIGFLVIITLSGSCTSSLTASVFLASVVSLVSEAIRWDFLLRSPDSSCLSYTHIYQTVGELPAFVFGWSSLLSQVAFSALAAISLGKILHNVVDPFLELNQENLEIYLGCATLALISIMIAYGLEVNGFLIFLMRSSAFIAFVIFIAGSSKTSIYVQDEKDLYVSALVVTVFQTCSMTRKNVSRNTVCAIIGFSFGIKFVLAMILAASFTWIISNKENVTTNGTTSTFIGDLIQNGDQHHDWRNAFLSYVLFVAVGLGLCRLLENGRNQFKSLMKDGLIWPSSPKVSTAFIPLCSAVSLSLMTMNSLSAIAAFNQLIYHAVLGFVIVHKRYCGASPTLRHLKSILYRSFDYETQNDAEIDTDSDDTDIDTVVDECKTQIYVSTIMPWEDKRSRATIRIQNGGGLLNSSDKAKLLLVVSFCLELIVSSLISHLNSRNTAELITLIILSLVLFAAMFWLWLLPQKMRAAPRNGFKILCIPFLPLLSSLLNLILLMQLPTITWLSTLIWIIAGLSMYIFYGYRHSKLAVKVPDPSVKEKHGKLGITLTTSLHLLENSLSMYPQIRQIQT